MQDFKKLKVWQKAHELALLTYRLTAEFPRDEVFGLRNSMRRTGIDIPGYIAEACAKVNNAEVARTITVSIASANRLEYYSLIARDLTFLNDINHALHADKIVGVRKMLSGFNRTLED